MVPLCPSSFLFGLYASSACLHSEILKCAGLSINRVYVASVFHTFPNCDVDQTSSKGVIFEHSNAHVSIHYSNVEFRISLNL